MQEARGRLKELVEQLRQIDVKQGGGHTAAADIVYIYACTRFWFTPGPGYKVSHCTRDRYWHVHVTVMLSHFPLGS